MMCFCHIQMSEMTAGFQAGLPAFAAAMPAIPEVGSFPQLPELTSLAVGLGAFDSAMSMTMPEMPSGLTLPSPGDLAALEMLAQVSGSLGINPFGEAAASEFAMAAGSMSFNAPALSELAASLPAIAAPLAPLQPLVASIEAIEATFGINIAMEGAMPALEMQMASMAAGLPALGELPAIPPPKMGELARLMNASASLGFDLTSPSGLPDLMSAMEGLSGLPIPALSAEMPPLPPLMAALSTMESASGALGLNLMSPGAGEMLAPSLPTLAANLGTLSANLGLPFSLPEATMASLSASAELGMAFAPALPAGGMDFSGLPMPPDFSGLPTGGIPDLSALGMASALAGQFAFAAEAPILSSVPCPNPFCVAG